MFNQDLSSELQTWPEYLLSKSFGCLMKSISVTCIKVNFPSPSSPSGPSAEMVYHPPRCTNQKPRSHLWLLSSLPIPSYSINYYNLFSLPLTYMEHILNPFNSLHICCHSLVHVTIGDKWPLVFLHPYLPPSNLFSKKQPKWPFKNANLIKPIYPVSLLWGSKWGHIPLNVQIRWLGAFYLSPLCDNFRFQRFRLS